jgi:cobalt/nickel transport system permease protein
VSHLHIPDGVLPAQLWGAAWGIALLVLVLSGLASRQVRPQEIAYRGSLGALLLAAMAFTVPLGPIEYHLGLIGPVGVLLGAAGAFEVLFIVSAILALAGHGGLTVIGLNALLLGAGAVIARPVYLAARSRTSAATALALASAASQAFAGTAWVAVMMFALRSAASGTRRCRGPPASRRRCGSAGSSSRRWSGHGLGRFLARVKPELLPGETTAHARGALLAGEPC